MTIENNDAYSGASLSDAVLGADLERELRALINPMYEDVRGTESHERKRLLGEIDRLRVWIKHQGEVSDTCTRTVLGAVCDGCRCGKKVPNG